MHELHYFLNDNKPHLSVEKLVFLTIQYGLRFRLPYSNRRLQALKVPICKLLQELLLMKILNGRYKLLQF